MKKAFALFVIILLAGTPPLAAQTKITPDEFLDQAADHTLTFRNFRTDRLIGIEEFLDRTRSVWARDDGTCTYGRIEIQDAMVCFHYEDNPGVAHCWQPYLHKGELLVISPERDIQRVSQISDAPVVCEDVPVS